jgi:hypothetical protein
MDLFIYLSIFICPRICIDRVLTEIFNISVAAVLCCGRWCFDTWWVKFIPIQMAMRVCRCRSAAHSDVGIVRSAAQIVMRNHMWRKSGDWLFLNLTLIQLIVRSILMILEVQKSWSPCLIRNSKVVSKLRQSCGVILPAHSPGSG